MKSCERCGDLVLSTHPRARFCSERCRKRAEKARHERRRRAERSVVATPSPRGCSDCGTTQGMDWWVGRHSPKPDGRPPTAAARCWWCYNAHCRQRPSQQRKLKGIRTHEKLIGPPAPSPRLWHCSDCGEWFELRNGSRRCVPCSIEYNTKRRSESHGRRLRAEAAGDRSIHWLPLGERDGWKCHLCGCKVPKVAGTARNMDGATVDHLVPLAQGGEHVWENVALAHRRCNISRGARGVAQLRLVG